MTEQIQNDQLTAEAGNPDGEALAAAAFALALDHAIPLALGLRAEVMDDCVKVWPREVQTPDETNFLIGARFTQNLDETRNILDGLGATLAIEDHADHFVAVITSGDSGELRTRGDRAALAAAFGLYALLTALRRSKT